jgi:hypothetical protein
LRPRRARPESCRHHFPISRSSLGSRPRNSSGWNVGAPSASNSGRAVAAASSSTGSRGSRFPPGVPVSAEQPLSVEIRRCQHPEHQGLDRRHKRILRVGGAVGGGKQIGIMVGDRAQRHLMEIGFAVPLFGRHAPFDQHQGVKPRIDGPPGDGGRIRRGGGRVGPHRGPPGPFDRDARAARLPGMGPERQIAIAVFGGFALFALAMFLREFLARRRRIREGRNVDVGRLIQFGSAAGQGTRTRLKADKD